ncbi:bifunctional diguanylate cyclase/phosphodiesterase [Mixta theicola]|uniref:diguanylate cyclase n=1 Tax=Mixta theicola TaxID=1458355 RepID=A0A2K1Q6J1_9GAMM|nr:EAL domain-containing protein [Mixta theicola]PNS10664.1 bifunctional diguanylate cyclase/phosphodiesterase [Mixta theicola]GLR10949.1 bifunctional diguanylate cyclase/phosphodiesterase [Mixta theicola]
MFNKDQLPERFRREFIREVIFPLAAVLLITWCAASFSLVWISRHNNSEAIVQQENIIKSAFSQSMTEHFRQLHSLTNWPPLDQHLQQPNVDPRWLDDNVGHWLYEMFGHQDIFILDPDGRILSSWQNGQRIDNRHWSAFEEALAPWLLRQDRSHGGRGIQGTVDFARIDGRAALVAINNISNEEISGGFRLVGIKYFDDAFLNELAQHSLINGLHYIGDRPAPTGQVRFQLISRLGLSAGYFAWRPEQPGSQMMKMLMPLFAAVLLVTTLVCIIMIYRLWRLRLRLTQSILRLEASEAQAQHLAFHDVLTGLPNRALIDERLTQALARAARSRSQAALLLLDLDRFKNINDTYGHHAGDDLIIEVSHRLSTLLRDVDTVGRIGGDEFVIVLEDIQDLSEVDTLCQGIIDALAEPYMLLGSEVWIGASIGIAIAPQDGLDRQDLMRKADIALYEAKNEGRAQYRRFARAMDESVQTRQQIAAELRHALQQQQGLEVWYQPLMDVAGEQILGFEALLRWRHAQRGFIAPSEFIPIAEETGLILQIGEWVLREACQVSLRWPTLSIAINVSPLQFRAAGFVQRFKDIVQMEGADPHNLELEITEGVLIEDEREARTIIIALREAGFRIALDDFGTGYSSLNYLSNFPVDKIKIDRSFTQSLGVAENSTAIVESVVRLGHAMGLTVTAEGVETNGQMSALAEAGCNQLQGYLFSQAVPPDQIAPMLEKRKAG